MKPLIIVLLSLLEVSRDCHGFGISIPPRIAATLSRHSYRAAFLDDDLHEQQNDVTAADLEILRAEIEEMGGDTSFLPDRREPLASKLPKEEFPTKENVLLRAPTSFLGSLDMHPLISKALEEEEIFGKEGYNEQNDSVADLEALREEIEAMGGDPSFLPGEQPFVSSNQEGRLKVGGEDDNYNEQNDSVEDLHFLREEIEAMGGDPWFLPNLQREPLISSKQKERLKAGGDAVSFLDNYKEQNDSVADMEDLQAEIEAMGGDPWFLPSERKKPLINIKQSEWFKGGEHDSCNGQNDSVSDLETLPAEIEAMGGDPSFLPRSVQRESLINSKEKEWLRLGGDANDNKQNDSVANLEEIEAMGGDPWFLPIQQTSRDPMINKRRKEEQVLIEEEELLQIGGDPSFLPNYNEQNDPNRDMDLLLAEIEEMGGDPSFL